MRTPSLSRPSPRAVLAALGAAAVIAIVLVGQFAGGTDAASGPVSLSAGIAVSCTLMGAVALAAVPGHAVGRLLLACGLAATVAAAAVSWSEWVGTAWLSQWTWWPSYGLLFGALLVFPDGKLPSPRWRWLGALLALSIVGGGAVLAVAAAGAPRTLLSDSDTPVSDSTKLLLRVFLVIVLLTAVALVAVVASLWGRWRRAGGETRQQLACLLPSALLLAIGLVLDVVNLEGGWLVAAVAVPLGMTFAVLRYRLYDIDRILNRTIVWLVMTLLVIAAFIGIVTLLRDLLLRNVSTDGVSLVTTGLVAVGYAPLHRRVQQGVNKLLYGERDDPYKVISGLGDVLGRTAEHDAVLPLLTDTIARSLQVPYVAVEVEDQRGARVLASYGRVGPTVEAFDMVSHGERLGRLLVSPRTDGGKFSPRETALLADIALHAAVAVEASRLTRDLQESRERLVVAREEERRRLRRDLHDGLGPSLTGMSMQVRAARKLAGAGRVQQILDALAGDLTSCTVEVRQLVDELRPPALDRGLAAALRDECRRFDSPALSVELDLIDDLDRLPAAVEVAAYRVVSEALNNVARHSGARNCVVTVSRDRALTVQITDDGTGITTPFRAGVGLNSMRERAGELGGEYAVLPVEPHGTTIRVRFPVASVTLSPEPEAKTFPMPDEALVAVEQNDAPAAVLPGAAATPVTVPAVPVKLWPGGVVPYELAPDIGPEEHVREAIDHLESLTPIRFVPRTDEHADYVRFEIGPTFSSPVGRVGGRQHVVVNAGAEMGQVLHEICHALGRWHEHSRPDRDQYVTVRWANITPDATTNFLIQATNTEAGPYDYESVMHYPRVSFSISGARTLETVQPTPQIPPGLPLGQRTTLSDGDRRVLTEMYRDPPTETITVESPEPPSAVTGALQLPTPSPPGPAARVVVGIRDVSLANGEAVTIRIGETVLTDVALAAGGRIPFEVTVHDVDPTARYAVEAHVDVDGAGTIGEGDLVTTVICPVLTQGAPADLVVPLSLVV